MNKKNIILILVGILIISMRFNVTFGHINIDVTNDCVGFLLIIIGVLPMINRNSRFKKSGIVAIVGFIASVIAQVINFIDWQEAAHGRAPAVATAVKRLWPDRLVFTYQGDGDLACIGTAETIHALNRGENITIIFINNAIYGMTGGQMAPTTLVGMKSSTCPYGRDVELHGYPLKITEIAAQLEGTAYVTRQSVQSVPAIRKAKKAIRKAFENSMNGKGSNLVEIVSTCSSGWKMTPEKANKWMEEHMFPFYPLGDLKDKE